MGTGINEPLPCSLSNRTQARRTWENLEMEAESELGAFTILGTSGKAETMKVPYAKRWQKETDKLRKIAVDCDLTEALKWGKPCFTFQKKNVAIVIPLKESCAFSFFKGALLKDPQHILKKIGQQQAGRWIKFTSLG